MRKLVLLLLLLGCASTPDINPLHPIVANNYTGALFTEPGCAFTLYTDGNICITCVPTLTQKGRVIYRKCKVPRR